MFNKEIKVGNKIIAKNQPVFIIAEAGVNHNGDISMAKQLIDLAKEANADAVKFQTFTAEKLNTVSAPKATYHVETTGDEQSWFDLLKSQELSREDHVELLDHCKKKDIMFLSTPYDSEGADLLKELGVPLIKVASSDNNNIPFLRHLASLDIPLIVSTAMCDMAEIGESIVALKAQGVKNLVVLHCTGNYPAELENINLRAMQTIEKEFDVLIGYSDHNLSHINPIAATALGATVYEKHFTLDKTLPGPDHRASLSPEELKQFVADIRNTEVALGSSKKVVLESEKENRTKLKKSIVANVDIKRGQTIDESMLCVKRPGTGLAPKLWDSLIGKTATTDIKKDSLLTESEFE